MSTFTQLYTQIVFSTKNREPILDVSWRQNLYNYITHIIQKRKHKIFAIGGTNDHIHILISFKQTDTLSSLMLEVKRGTSIWIKENKLLSHRFECQEGYGAFSYSHSQIDTIVKYILNQEEHHKKKSSKREYINFLDSFSVDYDEKYVK
jgi:REP element-mobilizing transposase RayT